MDTRLSHDRSTYPWSCDLLAALYFSTVELRQCKITNELSVTRATQATQKAPGPDRINFRAVRFPSWHEGWIATLARQCVRSAGDTSAYPEAAREILIQKPGTIFRIALSKLNE
jgi:hypothetical protein